jgi:hypothetical protein
VNIASLFGFGKNQTPPEPIGKGVGPSFAGGTKEASLDPRTPYTIAAPTYVDPATDVLAQQAVTLNRGFTANQQPLRYIENSVITTMNPQEHLTSGDGGPSEMGYYGAPRDPQHGFGGTLGGVWQPSEYQMTVRSPSNYRFTRPGWEGTPYLNGNHFSQADHPTGFPSVPFGMTASGLRRNTYRVEPPPWDANVYDTTKETQGLASTPVNAVNVESAGFPQRGKTYRLG